MTTKKEQTASNAGRAVTVVALFNDALASLTGEDEMAMQQINLLLSLYIHGEIQQSELHKFTKVQKSANSRNVQKLGPGRHLQPGLGLVEVYPLPTDTRINIVRLTPKGRAILNEAAIKASVFLD